MELERQTATTTVGNARGTRKHIKMIIKQSWREAANSGHRYRYERSHKMLMKKCDKNLVEHE